MTTRTQTASLGSWVTRKRDLAAEAKGFFEMSVLTTGHQPSWKRHGDGSCRVDISTHRDGKHLSIWTEEVSHEGRGSSKAASATLDAPAAQMLFDLMVRAGFTASEDATR
jgi:hypothetical protein